MPIVGGWWISPDGKIHEISDHRMFIEANPISVKWALHQMGKITSGIRLPLTPLSEPLREPLRAALKQAGLI